MVSTRLLSLAAGVIPELIKDPARFVEVTAGARMESNRSVV